MFILGMLAGIFLTAIIITIICCLIVGGDK